MINPIFVKSSHAIGSTPVEICIDKFIQNGNSYDFGVNYCYKFTKDSVKCMNFLQKKNWDISNAAKLCNGGGNGSYKCMTALLKKFNWIPPNGAAQRCFGTKL